MSRWLVVELLVDPPEKRPKGLGEAEELMSQMNFGHLWILESWGMAHEPGTSQQKLKVCGRMKADKKIKVKRLDPDQAWELFQRNASKDVIRSDAGINPLAKQVADECAGLPLALITAGQAMSTKKTWEAWNDALTLMRHAKTPEIAAALQRLSSLPHVSTWRLQLQEMEDLALCNDMEELISDAGASTSFSFSLSRLPLDSLHELNCISRQPLTLPYLKSIEVINC
ncbi:hypothetical protein GW17_00040260 [Ensete ventricosum]|nr:hypothetical protein GW17_00040260 [Ensete ventricosum]